MRIIKCPECGREISDKSEYCVYCGCPAIFYKWGTDDIKGQERDVEDNSARNESIEIDLNGCDAKESDNIELNKSEFDQEIIQEQSANDSKDKKSKKRLLEILIVVFLIGGFTVLMIVIGCISKTNSIEKMIPPERYDAALEYAKKYDYATAADYMEKANYDNSKELAKIYRQISENNVRRFVDDRFYYWPDEYQKVIISNLKKLKKDEYSCTEEKYISDDMPLYYMVLEDKENHKVSITMYDVKEDGSFGSMKLETESSTAFSDVSVVQLAIFLQEHNYDYAESIWTEMVNAYQKPYVKDGLKFVLSIEKNAYSMLMTPNDDTEITKSETDNSTQEFSAQGRGLMEFFNGIEKYGYGVAKPQRDGNVISAVLKSDTEKFDFKYTVQDDSKVYSVSIPLNDMEDLLNLKYQKIIKILANSLNPDADENSLIESLMYVHDNPEQVKITNDIRFSFDVNNIIITMDY